MVEELVIHRAFDVGLEHRIKTFAEDDSVHSAREHERAAGLTSVDALDNIAGGNVHHKPV